MDQKFELDELHATLKNHLPPEVAKEVHRILYGNAVPTLEVPKDVREYSEQNDFDLQAYAIAANPEQTRPKKLVRIGAIQNKIVAPTNAPVVQQREAIHNRVGKLIDAAGRLGVSVLCLQEAWHMPFAFCTREKQPWCEFAEDAYEGPSTKFLQEVSST